MKTTLPIYDLTPFTMLDFPDRTAAIVWFAGCNMRCAYCHNPQIVRGKSGRKSAEDVLSFLKKRQGLLDGIVLSGGEATLYKDIIGFAESVKRMGFAIKLDTNGTRPDIVRQMLDRQLLDFIALDYKAPPSKTKTVTGVKLHTPFEQTLSMLCAQTKVPFEVRTTVHTHLMGEEDIMDIANDLHVKRYKGPYHVQNYMNNGGPTLGDLPEQSRILSIPDIRESTPDSVSISARYF